MPTKTSSESPALDDAQGAVVARLRELDDALASVKALEEERDRLRRALELLGGRPAAKNVRNAGVRGRRKATPRSGGGRYRNRDAVLAHLRQNPGCEAGAIVTATGMNRGVAYNLLGRLVKQDLIRREDGPNGRARYYETGDGAAVSS